MNYKVPTLINYEKLKSFITGLKIKINDKNVGIGAYYTSSETYMVLFDYDSSYVTMKVIGGKIGTDEYLELFNSSSVSDYMSKFINSFYKMLCDNHEGLFWLNDGCKIEDIYVSNILEILLDDIFNGIDNFMPKPSLYIGSNYPIFTKDDIETEEDVPISIQINKRNTMTKCGKIENNYDNFDNELIKMTVDEDKFYLKVDYNKGTKYVKKFIESDRESIFNDLLKFVKSQDGKGNFDKLNILMDSLNTSQVFNIKDYSTYFLYQFNEVITYMVKNDIENAKDKFIGMFFNKGRPNVYNILNNNIFILAKYIEENLNESEHQTIGNAINLANTGYDNCGIIWDNYYRQSFNDIVQSDSSDIITGDNYKTNLTIIGSDKIISLDNTINVNYYIPSITLMKDYEENINPQLNDEHYEPIILKNIVTDNIDNYINEPIVVNYKSFKQVDSSVFKSVDQDISKQFMSFNEERIHLRCYNPISKNQWSNACENSYCKCTTYTCETDFLNMFGGDDESETCQVCSLDMPVKNGVFRLLRRTFGYDPIHRYNDLNKIIECNTNWELSDDIFKPKDEDEFKLLRNRMTKLFNLDKSIDSIPNVKIELDSKNNINLGDTTCFAYILTIENNNSEVNKDVNDFHPYISYDTSGQIWTNAKSSSCSGWKSIYGKELFVSFDTVYKMINSEIPFYIQNNDYHLVIYGNNSSFENLRNFSNGYKQPDLNDNISEYLPIDLITDQSKYFYISDPSDRNTVYVNVTNEYYNYVYKLLNAYIYNILDQLATIINEDYSYFYMINKTVTYSSSEEFWNKHFKGYGSYINIPLGRTGIFIENELIMKETVFRNNAMFDKLYDQYQDYHIGLKFGPQTIIFIPFINNVNSLYYLTVGNYVDTGVNVEIYKTENGVEELGKTIYTNFLKNSSKVGLIIYSSDYAIDPDSQTIMNAYFGNYDTSELHDKIGKSVKVGLKFMSFQSNECEIDLMSTYNFYATPVNITASFNTTKNKNLYFKTIHETELH